MNTKLWRVIIDHKNGAQTRVHQSENEARARKSFSYWCEKYPNNRITLVKGENIKSEQPAKPPNTYKSRT